MFSSNGNFRDLILYIIPGNVTIYFLLGIFKLWLNLPYYDKINSHLTNVNFVILFVSLSTLIGYIQSKFLLTIYNYISNNPSKDYRLLKISFKDSIIKNQLIENISSDFKIENKINKIENDSEIFSLCYHFTASRTDNHSFWYPERLVSFSMFVAVISLPLSMALLYFIISLEVSVCFKLCFIITLIPLCFYYCFNQSILLKRDWIKNVYRLYLALSLKDKTIANKSIVTSEADTAQHQQ